MDRLQVLAVAPDAADDQALSLLEWALGAIIVLRLGIRACDATLGIMTDPQLLTVNVMFRHDGSFEDDLLQQLCDDQVRGSQIWLDSKLPGTLRSSSNPSANNIGLIDGQFLPGYNFRLGTVALEDVLGESVPVHFIGELTEDGNERLRLNDAAALRAAFALERLKVPVERHAIYPQDG